MLQVGTMAHVGLAGIWRAALRVIAAGRSSVAERGRGTVACGIDRTGIGRPAA